MGPTDGDSQAQLDSTSVSSPAVDSSTVARDVASNMPDQAPKPAGTGVFMPMVARTYTNGRNKPQRRRNASTSCLVDTSRSRLPRRNISNANLDVLTQQSRLAGSAGAGSGGSSSSEAVLAAAFATDALGGGQACLSRGTNTMLASSAVSSSTNPMMLPTSQGPSTGPQPQQGPVAGCQQRLSPLQQQRVSPFAALSGTVGSAANSPRISSLDSEVFPMSACISMPADLRALPTAANANIQQESSAQPASSVGFMPFRNGVMQPGVGAGGAQARPSFDLQTSIPMSALAMQSAAPARQDQVLGAIPMQGMQRSFSLTELETALCNSSNSALLGGTQAAPSMDPIMSQWSALGLSEQDLLSALTHVEAAGDANLEQQQDQIQQHINKLSLMKQLLQLKQQHKAQQRLLQLQQQQQEQLLQQKLLTIEALTSGTGAPTTDTQSLQQNLLQLLQNSNRTSELSTMGMTMPASTGLHVCASGLLAGNEQPSTAVLMSCLQEQQQLDGRSLQGVDPAALGSILQEELQLRQPHLSAPSSLLAQQQLGGATTPNTLTPAQSLVLQGWGQL